MKISYRDWIDRVNPSACTIQDPTPTSSFDPNFILPFFGHTVRHNHHGLSGMPYQPTVAWFGCKRFDSRIKCAALAALQHRKVLSWQWPTCESGQPRRCHHQVFAKVTIRRDSSDTERGITNESSCALQPQKKTPDTFFFFFLQLMHGIFRQQHRSQSGHPKQRHRTPRTSVAASQARQEEAAQSLALLSRYLS